MDPSPWRRNRAFESGVIQGGLLPPMAAAPEVDPVDPTVPTKNSHRYFSVIGTPASQKRRVIAIGGHFIPRDLLTRETLDWLIGIPAVTTGSL